MAANPFVAPLDEFGQKDVAAAGAKGPTWASSFEQASGFPRIRDPPEFFLQAVERAGVRDELHHLLTSADPSDTADLEVVATDRGRNSRHRPGWTRPPTAPRSPKPTRTLPAVPFSHPEAGNRRRYPRRSRRADGRPHYEQRARHSPLDL